MAKVYRSTDNFEAAREVQKGYDRGLGGMAHTLLHPNYDGQRRIGRTGGVADYL